MRQSQIDNINRVDSSIIWARKTRRAFFFVSFWRIIRLIIIASRRPRHLHIDIIIITGETRTACTMGKMEERNKNERRDNDLPSNMYMVSCKSDSSHYFHFNWLLSSRFDTIRQACGRYTRTRTHTQPTISGRRESRSRSRRSVVSSFRTVAGYIPFMKAIFTDGTLMIIVRPLELV